MTVPYISLLGKTVKDRVINLQGVAESLSYDLYGCIQVCVRPPVDADGKIVPGYWVDAARLIVVSETRSMEPPDYSSMTVAQYVAGARGGPSDKPMPGEGVR